jgi:hypothetical protein
MGQVAIDNPYKIESYGLSWEEIRKHTNNLVSHYPKNYKLAYFNDYYQKVILLIKSEYDFTNGGNPNVLIISKIDNTEEESLVSLELKGYYGDIASKEDFVKGWSSLYKISCYLKLFEAQ